MYLLYHIVLILMFQFISKVTIIPHFDNLVHQDAVQKSTVIYNHIAVEKVTLRSVRISIYTI